MKPQTDLALPKYEAQISSLNREIDSRCRKADFRFYF